MATLLYTGEMIAALSKIEERRTEESRQARKFLAAYRELNDAVARALAAELDVTTTPDTHMEDGRYAAAFRPSFDGQAMPEILKHFDDEGDWDE